mmetsp:Transcript_29315/g.86725  ORF Transcript_29315/g.86725 Transcript_29315/m.86725 type:complete len:234 (+) Transcript_29315:404-1105(+)
MRDATNWSRRTSAPASKPARCTRTSARYSSRSTPFAPFRAFTTRRRCGSTPTRPAHRRCLTCTPWRERRVERCWAGWAARRAATRSWSLAARAAARLRRRSTRSHSSSPSRWAEVEAEERAMSRRWERGCSPRLLCWRRSATPPPPGTGTRPALARASSSRGIFAATRPRGGARAGCAPASAPTCSRHLAWLAGRRASAASTCSTSCWPRRKRRCRGRSTTSPRWPRRATLRC